MILVPNELFTQNVMFPDDEEILYEGETKTTKVFNAKTLKDLYDESLHDGYNKLDVAGISISRYNDNDDDPFEVFPVQVTVKKTEVMSIQVIEISGYSLFLPSHLQVAVKTDKDKLAIQELGSLSEGSQILCRMFESIVGFQPISKIKKKLKFEIINPFQLSHDIDEDFIMPLGVPQIQLYAKV